MPWFGPIVSASGPRRAKIAIVGEAPGREESEALAPFVGASGKMLDQMLALAGIDRAECFITNVFSRQPEGNNAALYGVPRAEASAASLALGPMTREPITYAGEGAMRERARLLGELAACAPNVVLALGNSAVWALLGRIGIAGLRGTVFAQEGIVAARPLKVLPTYHPAAILRDWTLRVVSIGDMERAKDESSSPLHRPAIAQLWLEPTLADLAIFERRFLMPRPALLALDVETRAGQITCLGIAPSARAAICVPFWCEAREGSPESVNYWRSAEDELLARAWLSRLIEDPEIRKVTQNGLYDVQYLVAEGWSPRGFVEDTMLMHHSLYCEMPKGLGWLGATYTRFGAWKHFRQRVAREEAAEKRDD